MQSPFRHLLVALAVCAGAGLANPGHATEGDAALAAKAMRDIWDRPDAPLVIEPVAQRAKFALFGQNVVVDASHGTH